MDSILNTLQLLKVKWFIFFKCLEHCLGHRKHYTRSCWRNKMHLVSSDCVSNTVVTGQAGDSVLLHALASDAHSGSSSCLDMHVTPIMRTTSTSECLPRIRDCHRHLVAISFYPHTLRQVAGWGNGRTELRTLPSQTAREGQLEPGTRVRVSALNHHPSHRAAKNHIHAIKHHVSSCFTEISRIQVCK